MDLGELQFNWDSDGLRAVCKTEGTATLDLGQVHPPPGLQVITCPQLLPPRHQEQQMRVPKESMPLASVGMNSYGNIVNSFRVTQISTGQALISLI